MEIEIFPKIRHFIWQTLSGCVSVTSNLRNRGINYDTQCARCGPEEETINHMFFECPPSLQTLALSQVLVVSGIFPMTFVFSNFDYLFWRFPNSKHEDTYPWII